MKPTIVALVLTICCFGAFGSIIEIPDMPTKVVGGFAYGGFVTADQSRNRVYVCDRGGDHNVKVFNRKGKLLFTIDEGLADPTSTAVSESGLLYVVDYGNSNVVIMTEDGERKDTIENSAFISLYDIAIGPDGLLYVSDYSAREVHVLMPDGQYLRVIYGIRDQPMGIAFGTDGRLHVTLIKEDKILVLDTNGNQLDSIDLNGFEPLQIDIDNCGYIYTVGREPPQVRIYDEYYTPLRTITGYSTAGMGYGVALLGSKLYTTDFDGGKLYIF